MSGERILIDSPILLWLDTANQGSRQPSFPGFEAEREISERRDRMELGINQAPGKLRMAPLSARCSATSHWPSCRFLFAREYSVSVPKHRRDPFDRCSLPRLSSRV